MAFYVSQYTGDGATPETAFRPVAGDAADAAGQQWAGIDLRADATQRAGWCFVWTSGVLTPLPTGVILVAASADDVPHAAVRNAIKNELGVTVSNGTTFRQMLRDFMTSEARLDGTRWAPLVPDASGQLRLFLGEHVDVWQS